MKFSSLMRWMEWGCLLFGCCHLVLAACRACTSGAANDDKLAKPHHDNTVASFHWFLMPLIPLGHCRWKIIFYNTTSPVPNKTIKSARRETNIVVALYLAVFNIESKHRVHPWCMSPSHWSEACEGWRQSRAVSYIFCNGIPRQFPPLLPSTAASSLWDRFSARFDLPTVHRPYVCCRGCNEREHAFQICIAPSFLRNNVDNNFLI